VELYVNVELCGAATSNGHKYFRLQTEIFQIHVKNKRNPEKKTKFKFISANNICGGRVDFDQFEN
jgi:hypothetical protein